jgi:hypothetical protein
MKRAIIPAFVIFASALFTSASAQTLNLSSISDPKASLNDKMSILLASPHILSELSLTSEQTTKLAVRTMLYPMRQLAKTIVALEKADANEESPMGQVKFDTTNLPQLTLDDLSGGQKKRLKELYFQADPTNALLTKDLRTELRLSSAQCKRLEQTALKIGAIYMASVKKYMTKDAFSGFDDITTVLTSLRDDTNSEEAQKALIEKFERLTTQLENCFIRVLARVENEISQMTSGFNKNSLKILTPKQRAKYEKLCGRKMKG